MTRRVVVEAYNPLWQQWFDTLKARIWPAVADVAQSIEHVGSTSVEGLAAKPIIDIDLVLAKAEALPVLTQRLAGLGYEYQGNLGLEGREAFKAAPGLFPPHHLYACVEGALPLRNHLALRDYLRSHPDTAFAYGQLKLSLAQHFPHDIDGYVWGKTAFVLEVLAKAGLEADQLEVIAKANSKP